MVAQYGGRLMCRAKAVLFSLSNLSQMWQDTLRCSEQRCQEYFFNKGKATQYYMRQSPSPCRLLFRQCGEDCQGREAAGPHFGITTPASEMQRCGNTFYGLQQREAGQQCHSKQCRITANLRTLVMYISGCLFVWLPGEGWAPVPACMAPALVWVCGAGAAALRRSGAGAVGSSSHSLGGTRIVWAGRPLPCKWVPARQWCPRLSGPL